MKICLNSDLKTVEIGERSVFLSLNPDLEIITAKFLVVTGVFTGVFTGALANVFANVLANVLGCMTFHNPKNSIRCLC